jgi:hypothetical protein
MWLLVPLSVLVSLGSLLAAFRFMVLWRVVLSPIFTLWGSSIFVEEDL